MEKKIQASEWEVFPLVPTSSYGAATSCRAMTEQEKVAYLLGQKSVRKESDAT